MLDGLTVRANLLGRLRRRNDAVRDRDPELELGVVDRADRDAHRRILRRKRSVKVGRRGSKWPAAARA